MKRNSGFTLVELLISVGLALMVLIGVNAVFKATADTIGTGTALAEANRTMRAVDTNFATDFNPQTAAATGAEVPGTGIIPSVSLTPATDPSQPAIAIRMERMFAFHSKADQDANNGQPADVWDTDGSGTMGPVPAYETNARNHRVDTLSFFTAGKTGAVGFEVGSFRRQTGQIINGRESLTTDLASPADAAWVWYGHARQPVNPDKLDLSAANYLPPGVGDAVTNPNNYYASTWTLARRSMLILKRDTAGGTLVAPNGYLFAAGGEPMHFFADDLTGITPISYGAPAVYTTDGTTYNATPTLATDDTRFQSSLFDIAALTDGVGATLPATGLYAKFLAGTAATYWPWLTQDGTMTATSPALRFNANPHVTGPLLPTTGQLRPSYKTALSSPILATGCTQFIVEFAGDFQAPAGLDVVDPDTTGPRPSEIQWYGLPRDVDGDGVLDVNVISSFAGAVATGERRVPSGTDPNVYACVWGTQELITANKPMLIRITVSLTDGNGRLQDGMTREFVYRVR